MDHIDRTLRPATRPSPSSPPPGASRPGHRPARTRQQAPPGTGERYRFRRTGGPESWTVLFSGDQVLLEPGSPAPVTGGAAGSTWGPARSLRRRVPPTAPHVTGGTALPAHRFTPVPPV
ncbi:hypothetical protein [Streptomyces yangpuensis]|uniref:hypothetical protein n=1 Tax=Streptomyces yangpuensis TaxID=1648182 RepID=UPI0036603590